MIREAAYFRAAHRAFEPGNALQDWLAAEREIDWLLALRRCYPPPSAEGTPSAPS
jgi:hypothetical protein